jgi:hypothetical protein
MKIDNMGFKNWLKKHLYILKVRNRFNASTQVAQRQLYLQHQIAIQNGTFPQLNQTGFRAFSQFEEDGLLLFIFAAIGMTHKTFVEIGSDDGINSNCANLALNFGWHGLFLDGNQTAIERGRCFYSKYPHQWGSKPVFTCAKVQCENINQLIEQAGLVGEIGLLSVDVDGNDYWLWNALEVVQPQVVVIETHVEFGMRNIVVPYDKDYFFPGKHPVYHGASPEAMVNLARKKGYRLVGANDLGFNFIFVRNGLVENILPEVTVESVLTHFSLQECYKRFDEVKDFDFLEG